MVVSNEGSEQVATQVAASTGTSGGTAGNNTTTGGAGPIASSTPVVAPRGYRHALQQMLQGWQELIPGDSTLLSSAGSLNQAAVLAQLQEYLGVYIDLDAHAMGTSQARAQAQSQQPEVRTYYAALKAAVISYFGVKSPQLVKFGLKPKKSPAPLTSTPVYAVRAAKVKATSCAERRVPRRRRRSRPVRCRSASVRWWPRRLRAMRSRPRRPRRWSRPRLPVR